MEPLAAGSFVALLFSLSPYGERREYKTTPEGPDAKGEKGNKMKKEKTKREKILEKLDKLAKLLEITKEQRRNLLKLNGFTVNETTKDATFLRKNEECAENAPKTAKRARPQKLVED